MAYSLRGRLPFPEIEKGANGHDDEGRDVVNEVVDHVIAHFAVVSVANAREGQNGH